MSSRSSSTILYRITIRCGTNFRVRSAWTYLTHAKTNSSNDTLGSNITSQIS
jgi:hypothetical protein